MQKKVSLSGLLRTTCRTVLFLLMITMAIPTAYSQNLSSQKISLQLTGSTLKEAFSEIQKQSGIKFIYGNDLNKYPGVKVSLKENNISVKNAIEQVLKSTNLRYTQRNEHVMIDEKPVTPPQQQQPGRISGKILSDRGEALPGATIKVLQSGQASLSSVDGSYTFSLEPGTYTLESSYIGFQNKRITEVVVKAGQITKLNVVLLVSSSSLQQVTVTSTFKRESIAGLYARQKNSAAVTDGISAEQIARTPDNNLGLVLRRIGGLQTTDDNKFAVVRGLGERYNNVQLNGSQLPSSEPNRRNFSFDMIPSVLVDNVVVNKTATPDYTGEFTGGLIQVTTKDIPASDFFQIDLGAGGNTMSTGKDFYGIQRGRYAQWGFLDKNVHGEPAYGKPVSMTFAEYNDIALKIKTLSATDKQLQKARAFMGSLPNTWQARRYTAQPMQSFSLSGGKLLELKNNQKLGFIGVLSYRNEQQINSYDLYQIRYKDYKGSEYQYITTLGGNFNLGYSFGKHKISWQNTYNRRFSDKMYRYTGIDLDATDVAMGGYTSQTLANELFQTKLQGQHALTANGIRLDWSADLAEVKRDQPFSRLMNGKRMDARMPENYYTYYFGNPASLDYGNLYYSKLREHRYAGQANLSVPFKVLSKQQLFKAGWLTSYRKANFGSDMYRLLYPPNSPAIGEYPGTPYYDVYNSKRFEEGEIFLYPISGGGADGANGTSSGYTGSQRLHAFYGMLDLKPLEKLRVVAGLRNEKYTQQVDTRIWKPGNTWETAPIIVKKTDWLPSANLIYALTSTINVRTSWYKTVARPDIRETSGFEYYDYEILRTILGANLKTTTIDNADVRLEWFPSPEEVVSVSGFYKKFKDPIELRMVATSGRPWYFYENLNSARDLGFEADFRKSFGFIKPGSFWKDLYLSGNFTWLKAEVEFTPNAAIDPGNGEAVQAKRSRPLTGQSPYIINSGLTYNGKRAGASLNYNRYGRRIVYTAVDRSMDEYENPRDMLDLQLSYKPLKNEKMLIRLNLGNLLNQELFTYINTYGPDGNANGEYKGQPSLQKYPDDVYKLPKEQLDPKDAAYNKAYDTKVTRRKFGVNYSLNVTYRF